MRPWLLFAICLLSLLAPFCLPQEGDADGLYGLCLRICIFCFKHHTGGTLILAGKIEYKLNNIPREALILLADDATLGPKDKTSVGMQKFHEAVVQLEGKEKVDYLLKNAEIQERAQSKVVPIGEHASEGLLAFAGQKGIKTQLEGKVRDIARLAKTAEEVRTKVENAVEAASNALRGAVVHCQFRTVKRPSRMCTLYDFRRPEQDVKVSNMFGLFQGGAAFGLGSEEKFVTKWAEQFFGKSYDDGEIRRELRVLSRHIQGSRFSSLIGAEFNGLILIDIASINGLSVYRVNTAQPEQQQQNGK